MMAADNREKKALLKQLTFLLITLFMVSMTVLLFELGLTRIFSIVLWYDYAFMAISVAFFGLGIGALLVHLVKKKMKKEHLLSKILQSNIAFAVSVPIFLFLIGHIIPSSPSFIYLFYLASSIPFFFAGTSMALIFLTMPKEITKLYFIDLAGAAAATLMLDPLMQALGAESVLLTTSLLIMGPSIITALILFNRPNKKYTRPRIPIIENRLKVYGLIVLAASAALLIANSVGPDILAIPPGENKGLFKLMSDPNVQHLSTQWNSFSRIDVSKYNGDPRELASITIDADAVTPIFKWNGTSTDGQWLREYLDYMPYQLSRVNSTLVIGGGGGEDILVALSAGVKNVTAVELNPLIVAAAKKYGGSLGADLYDRQDVKLYVDDGRRYISSTNSKYDMIVIKLVDSWAAQLAGGYALSENYLYTVEAFRQYLHHLSDNGMLVMVRWNFELPRLIPLIAESLRQEETELKSTKDISNRFVAIEDRPTLYFGQGHEQYEAYPVILILKNTPFTVSELDLLKRTAAKNDAKVIVRPGYVQPPYDRLLSIGRNTPTNQPSIPSYWNDFAGYCDIGFKCMANLTTGWNDNKSFQVFTNVTTPDTKAWIYGKQLDVNPNDVYEVVTHMKLNNFASQSHIVIEGLNATTLKWYQISHCPTGFNGPLEWKEFRCKITIPESTSKVRFALVAGWSSKEGENAITLFDAIYLNKINTTKNLISNPDFVYFDSQGMNDPSTGLLNLRAPTDDSPFYFAKEKIPHQLITLLETVLVVSAGLGLLLAYYSRINKVHLMTSSATSWLYVLFVTFIGLGFIFLEITFIQKFLLLLGTPIMALTVILFSILLSSGIGAYLSGKLFRKNPYKAVVVSIPLLVGILIAYYGLVPWIIDSSITQSFPQRIALTFALLSPVGVLMGFQFPSLIRMASSSFMNLPEAQSDGNITLLWGVNVIASVIGTVLAAISSMVIGLSGNLLVGLGLYLGALGSAIAATKIAKKITVKELA